MKSIPYQIILINAHQCQQNISSISASLVGDSDKQSNYEGTTIAVSLSPCDFLIKHMFHLWDLCTRETNFNYTHFFIKQVEIKF